MTAEVVQMRRWRSEIPKSHRTNLDTRLYWLWHQRFGTVQMVYSKSEDILDRTAATLILQAIMARDLRSIQQLFQRLEGGSIYDQDIIDNEQALRI
jgi:hypothetical protein